MKLNAVSVSAKSAAATDLATHHIFVIDCSGSMSYDLPRIRHQLRNKMPSLVKRHDLVSLVWFSGKGEFGKLVDRISVTDLTDLQRLNTAIERWLQPMGCTAFVEPLRSVKDICVNPTENCSLMFLTDGCDNEWGKSDILSASSDLATLLASAVLVEYGYYCNHSLLEEMAEKMGGNVLFAEDFDRYEPIFSSICSKSVSAKRIEVEIPSSAIDGVVWSCTDSGAVSYKVINGKVYVPMDVTEVYYLTDDASSAFADSDLKALYQCVGMLALRRNGNLARSILSAIGDVALYNRYVNAYGKQNTYDFADAVRIASLDETRRFADGKSVGCKPNEDAYTILDVLNDIKAGNASIDLAKFHYNRIGRKTEMSEDLSRSEKKTLAEDIASSSSVNEIQTLADDAVRLAKERSQMRFVRSADLAPIVGVTYNESRPNVSLLVRIDGSVGLPASAPSSLPSDLSTFVWRNFTVLKDGLLNVDVLPLKVDDAIVTRWKGNGVKCEVGADGVCEVTLRGMPIVNARCVTSVTARGLAEDVWSLMVAKADIKVAKAYLDEVAPTSKSASLASVYGDDVADYLKSIGITDSGYSPKVTLSAPTDKYIGTEFNVKFKGLSTIPSYNAFLKKLNSGKSLTVGESLLKPMYDKCEERKSAADFADFLKSAIADATANANAVYKRIVDAKFAILVGQTWFSDLDASANSLKCNGVDVTFEIEDKEYSI